MKENILRINLGWKLKKHAKKSGQRIWSDISENILASRKNRPSVNLSEISRSTKEGASVIVAGKVLGAGSINHKVIVAANSFSANARAKIVAAGGQCLGLQELSESNKSMKDVVLIG